MFILRKLIVFVLVVHCMFTVAYAGDSERKFLNLNSKGFNFQNSYISIFRSRKLTDTIMLLKSIEVSADSFSEDQLYKDAISFFDKLVRSYKFKNYDREKIAYGLFKNNYGFIRNRIYSIKIKEVAKINNRDFGEKDLNDIDRGKKPIPLEVILKHLKVINVRELSEDKKSTSVLLGYLKKFPLGGSLGFVETMVKKNWIKQSRRYSNFGLPKNMCYRTSGNYALNKYCTTGSCDGFASNYALYRLCKDNNPYGFNGSNKMANIQYYLNSGGVLSSDYFSDMAVYQSGKFNGTFQDRKNFILYLMSGMILMR